MLKNCRNNILESAAYALRSSVARRFRLFHDNVNVLIVMTAFAKRKLLQAGFREDQIAVVPNPASVRDAATNPSAGQYVAFAGRMSPEKGVDILLSAAERMPNVPFKVAGDGPLLSEMMARAPANVEFLGRLGPDELREFYGKSQLVVVPSVWFEQFPIVVLEAGARIARDCVQDRGLPEIVEEGITGSLFEPGNPEDLVQQVRGLWEDPELCNRMGRAGRQKVIREYTEDAYYHNLMAVYQTAIHRLRNSATVSPLVHISNAVMPASETDGR